MNIITVFDFCPRVKKTDTKQSDMCLLGDRLQKNLDKNIKIQKQYTTTMVHI